MGIESEITRMALGVAEMKPAEEVAAVQAKALEEEFGTGFFHGYSELKRRVALVHPEWYLTAFLGVESDFWELEALVEEYPDREDGETGATARVSEETEVVIVEDLLTQ